MAARFPRYSKWLRLCPPKTRALAAAVEAIVLPELEHAGFVRVDVELRRPGDPVSGNTIELERWTPAAVDCVSIGFEKYRTPRMQVHGVRRSPDDLDRNVRGANLVARSNQYYHFWGRPWWLPTGLWPETSTRRTAESVRRCVGQLVAFLETGTRTRNVSRAVD